MSLQLIERKEDIYQYPEVDTEHAVTDGSEFTIGDLHGNAIKLLFMLIYQGIATNISKEEYNSLVEIYKKPIHKLDSQDIGFFEQTINKMKFKTFALIRLIGDELADRGSNDYYTLLILNKLHQENVPFEIITSNHSVEFLRYHQKRGAYNSEIRPVDSLNNLKYLIRKGLISTNEVSRITETAYKGKLKAISYLLSDNKNEIIIYSHAPIDIKHIKALAKQFNLEYRDSNPMMLAKTIDKINEEVQKHIQNNTLDLIYTNQARGEVINFKTPKNLKQVPSYPFAFVLWNRDIQSLQRSSKLNGFKINYVHGHTSGITRAHIFNLDTELGKTIHDHVNQYKTLYTYSDPLKPLLEKIRLYSLDTNELMSSIEEQYRKKIEGKISEEDFKSQCSQTLLRAISKTNDPNLKLQLNLLILEMILKPDEQFLRIQLKKLGQMTIELNHASQIDDANILNELITQILTHCNQENFKSMCIEALLKVIPKTNDANVKHQLNLLAIERILKPDDQLFKSYLKNLAEMGLGQKKPDQSNNAKIINQLVIESLSQYGQVDFKSHHSQALFTAMDQADDLQLKLILNFYAVDMIITDTHYENLKIILKQIIKKGDQFINKKDDLAAAAVSRLCLSILRDYHQTTDTEQFKNSCLDALKRAKPELERHRDFWSKIFYKFINFFARVMILPTLLNKTNTRYFNFFKTDSSEQLEKLEKEIQKKHPNKKGN